MTPEVIPVMEELVRSKLTQINNTNLAVAEKHIVIKGISQYLVAYNVLRKL
jgi:hypothetical protein